MLSKLESRKECMEQIELIQHWNYFCSLAERLDDTKHYIDHGLQEHDGIRELVHGKVYSDIFKQIIVLAASEFEIMSKALCSAKGVKTKRIGDISETILGVFPKIIDFEVSTPFWINTPLHDWKTTRIDNGKNVKVEGLSDYVQAFYLRHLPSLLSRGRAVPHCSIVRKSGFVCHTGCFLDVCRYVHNLSPVLPRESDILSFSQLYNDTVFPSPLSEHP